MKIFETNISLQVRSYLNEHLKGISSLELANKKMIDACGINSFFENSNDLQMLINSVTESNIDIISEPDRSEYGDFQTNIALANKVIKRLLQKKIKPNIVIEPTCGQGNFILASLSNFKSLKKIIGIEIYKPYVWKTKFKILDFFLSNPLAPKPEITIVHQSVFDYDFRSISKIFLNEELLIIGNPPWVTNSKLGSLNSVNLPKKTNIKNQNGIDAITGKGNFDIAEYITMSLFESFQGHTGHLALLVKNSVIKNIVFDQRYRKHRISTIEKYCIDSKKEFNVSVEASLLFCQFNSNPGFRCKEFNFYDSKYKLEFGWEQSKFVSNIADYNETKDIDGLCQFEWRQGIKHDCTSIMELERANGHYVNNISEDVNIEEDLIFGFLKSSDLKNTVIKNTRKYTIVTQTKVGQETSYIQHSYPNTYNYLRKNISYFQNRKSSIYKGKPQFSIFGIGDYSFKPYKVAISGLYKTFHFSLVLPQEGKTVMLDDTCYFIGFDQIEYAVFALILLNSRLSEEFLKSITFSDAKRVFTKDILMRLDLLKLSKIIHQNDVDEKVKMINGTYDLNVNLSKWYDFISELNPKKEKQLSIFG
jgi:hypothetical protein